MNDTLSSLGCACGSRGNTSRNSQPQTGVQQPVQVTFNVTNTGSVAGADVAQVYVGPLPGVETPPRQLAGFQKVELAPGTSATVTIQIDPRSLSYWDTTTHALLTPPGAVPILVGSS